MQHLILLLLPVYDPGTLAGRKTVHFFSLSDFAAGFFLAVEAFSPFALAGLAAVVFLAAGFLAAGLAAAVFLASDDAAYISGVTLPVDGAIQAELSQPQLCD